MAFIRMLEAFEAKRGSLPFPYLLKANEISVPFSLKVDDATLFLLPLIQPFELFLLAQALCTGLVRLLGGKEAEWQTDR